MTLNKEQQEAVEYIDGPLLIVAGAGTGKTRVISEKIRFLVKEKKIKAKEILALTYTEKGAQEMDERVSEFLNGHIEPPEISTFHGFCYKVLQNHGLSIGLSGDFKMLTKPEQLLLLYNDFNKLNLKYYKPLANPTSCLKDLLSLFASLKSENITVGEYEREVQRHRSTKVQSEEEKKLLEEKIERISEEAFAYKMYNQILRENNALDYGDIIQLTYNLFNSRESVLAYYQKKFKYILIDEYQDTNIVQNEIIQLLADKHKNICVVGDDDQSIFHFQGASLSNILNFGNIYKGVKKVVLTENYRSGQNILDAAYCLIQTNNPERLEVKSGISKKLKSNSEEAGNIFKVEAVTWENELDYILQGIKNSKKEGLNYKDIAVLFRSHATGEKLLPLLKRNEIPYHVVEGPGLYEQEEIRIIRNIIKFLINPDDSLSLFHLLTLEYFDIDSILIVRLSNFASKNNLSLWTTINNYLSEILGTKQSEKLSLFSAGMEDANGKQISNILKNLEDLIRFQATHSAVQTVYEILYGDFELISLIEKKYEEEVSMKEQKIANLSKFYRRVEKFEYNSKDRTLVHFNEMLEVFIEAGEDPDQESINLDYDAVQLLSMHKSKGLEFDTVFVMGLAIRKFPTANRKNRIAVPEELMKSKIQDTDAHKREERRLMYVSMTRAKQNLHLIYSKTNPGAKREVKPSVFFLEVPDELSEKIIYDKAEISTIQNLFTVQASDIDTFVQANMQVSNLKGSISLSYSNIASYRRCPLQFKYQKIYKIPTEPKAYHQFGRYIHKILENLHHSINQNKTQSLDDMMSYYDKNWYLQSVGLFNEEHKEDYKKQGEEIIRNYYLNNEGSFKKALYLEKRFSFFVGNYKINGAIDRIDPLESSDECEVIDYKTGRPKTEKDLKRDKLAFLQLYIYAIACQDLLNKNATKLTFYYLTDGSKVTISPSPEDLSWAQEVIEETASQIRDNKFEAIPNDFICKICEYNKICPARIKKF